MTRKIGIVVQARMGSSRLPGKVLKKVCGKPLIYWLIERLKQSKKADLIICAIPDDSANYELGKICEENGVLVHCGSESDVLSRYLECFEKYDLTDAVRITGDCPIIDSEIIDRFIEIHTSGDWDLTANRIDCLGGFPRGMDVEVVTKTSLGLLSQFSLEERHREHVTLFFTENERQFKIIFPPPLQEEERSEFRFCVDYPSDLELIREIITYFYNEKSKINFSLREIINFLDSRPDIMNKYARIES